MTAVEEDDDDVPDAVLDGRGFVKGELEAWSVVSSSESDDVIGGSGSGGDGGGDNNSSNLA